jgi:hypothetical protein
MRPGVFIRKPGNQENFKAEIHGFMGSLSCHCLRLPPGRAWAHEAGEFYQETRKPGEFQPKSRSSVAAKSHKRRIKTDD